MTHARTQIRNAVAAALATTATAGANVFASRTDALSPEELPALLVETGSEQIEHDDFGRYQTRRVEIFVRAVARAGVGVDAVVDGIAAEVETAIQAAGSLGGLIKGAAQLVGIDTYFAGADSPTGESVLRYAALYLTQAGQPGTTL